jgi:hypothetical protein
MKGLFSLIFKDTNITLFQVTKNSRKTRKTNSYSICLFLVNNSPSSSVNDFGYVSFQALGSLFPPY